MCSFLFQNVFLFNWNRHPTSKSFVGLYLVQRKRHTLSPAGSGNDLYTSSSDLGKCVGQMWTATCTQLLPYYARCMGSCVHSQKTIAVERRVDTGYVLVGVVAGSNSLRYKQSFLQYIIIYLILRFKSWHIFYIVLSFQLHKLNAYARVLCCRQVQFRLKAYTGLSALLVISWTLLLS